MDEQSGFHEESSAPLVRVATVGAAHGLAGQVRLIPHTDDPAYRLASGTVVTIEGAESAQLTITMLRRGGDHWYVKFDGVPDRTAVEKLRGAVLLAPEDYGEEDAFYAHQLSGLKARRVSGEELGTIVAIEHFPVQDMLVLKENDGARTLIPFVAEIVPAVEIEAGYVVLDPPYGLLSGEAAEETGEEER